MVSFSLPLKEPSQNQAPLPAKPEGGHPEDRKEQLAGLEKPILAEEADPAAPARLGVRQEPMGRAEDTREAPAAEPQRPLPDPEEKIGEQV